MNTIYYNYYFCVGVGQVSSLHNYSYLDSNGYPASNTTSSTYKNYYCTGYISVASAPSKRFVPSRFIGFSQMTIAQYDADQTFIKKGYQWEDGRSSSTPLDTATKYIVIEVRDLVAPNENYFIGYTGINFEPRINKLSKKYERESGQRVFKQGLEGKIVIVGDIVQNYLIPDTYGKEFMICIMKSFSDRYNEQSSYPYFSGIFTKFDCEIDYSKFKATINTIKWNHPTTLLLDRQDDTIDILKEPLVTTRIKLTKRPYIQIYSTGNRYITSISRSGDYWEDEVSDPTISDTELAEKMHFGRVSWVGEAQVTADASLNTDYPVNGIYRCYLSYIPTTSEIKSAELVYEQVDGDYELVTEWRKMESALELGGKTYINTWYYQYGTLRAKKTTDSSSLPPPPVALCEYTSDDYDSYTTYGNKWFAPSLGTDASVNHINVTVKGRGDSYTDEAGYWADGQYARIISDSPLSGEDYRIDKSIDICNISTNYRYAKPVDNITKDSIVTSTYINSTPSIYGQTSGGLYYHPPGDDKVYLPVDKAEWGDGYSIWVLWTGGIENTFSLLASMNEVTYALKDAYSIGAIIKVLLSKIAPNVKFEETSAYSEFFYGDSGVINSYGPLRLYATQKTNILKGQYDVAAKKCETSFKDFMGMLASMFQCYWFIDDSCKLRIEHISWFLNGGSYTASTDKEYDLNTLKDTFNGNYASYHQSVVSYDKDILPARYEFKWGDDYMNNFGLDVDILNRYVQADKIEEIMPDCAVDIDYMLIKPDNFSDDGLAFLATLYNSDTVRTTTHTFKDPMGINYSASIQNAWLCWHELFYCYMYNISGSSMKLSNNPNTFTVQKLAKAKNVDVEFISEDDPSVFGLIGTAVGNGSIKSMVINLYNRVVSVTLEIAL